MSARILFFVALGSALGGGLRYGISELLAVQALLPLPWGTFAVNATGSMAVGWLATLSTEESGRIRMGEAGRQFLMTGVCGGYTTFSLFSLETLMLFERGDQVTAVLNVLITMATCLLAVWAGHGLAARLNGRSPAA